MGVSRNSSAQLVRSGIFALLAVMFILYSAISGGTNDNKQGRLCRRVFSSMRSAIVDQMDVRGFCSCAADAAAAQGREFADEDAIDDCLDKYMEAASQKECDKMATRFSQGRLSCSCYSDHMKRIFRNHIDAAQSGRTISPDEAKEEGKSFSACVN